MMSFSPFVRNCCPRRLPSLWALSDLAPCLSITLNPHEVLVIDCLGYNEIQVLHYSTLYSLAQPVHQFLDFLQQ